VTFSFFEKVDDFSSIGQIQNRLMNAVCEQTVQGKCSNYICDFNITYPSCVFLVKVMQIPLGHKKS